MRNDDLLGKLEKSKVVLNELSLKTIENIDASIKLINLYLNELSKEDTNLTERELIHLESLLTMIDQEKVEIYSGLSRINEFLLTAADSLLSEVEIGD